MYNRAAVAAGARKVLALFTERDAMFKPMNAWCDEIGPADPTYAEAIDDPLAELLGASWITAQGTAAFANFGWPASIIRPLAERCMTMVEPAANAAPASPESLYDGEGNGQG